MLNLQVGWHLEEIADLLELQGANPHKIRAFRRAARKLASLSKPLDQVDLKTIPGIGEKIAEEVLIFLEKGATPLLKNLLENTPQTVLEIREIPGIDLKTAYRIYRWGGINKKEQLKKVVQKRELRTIPGIGAKVEKDIKDFLQQTRERGHFLLSLAESEAEAFINRVENIPAVEKIGVTGAVRRGEELVDGINILLGTREFKIARESISLLPRIKTRTVSEDFLLKLELPGGVPLKVKLVPPEEYALELIKTTGPTSHWDFLAKIAREKGFNLIDEGFFYGGKKVFFQEEKEIYTRLEMPYPPPEVRHRVLETGKDFSLVEKIIDFNDIKGDFHLHTRWSDGGSTIEEMVKKAQSLRYEYLVITDHSMALEFAGGMSIAALQEQMEYIERLNEKLGKKYVLTGIEADIEMDGSLDVPQRFLDRMDWVMASIHRGLKLPRQEMTKRLVRAVSHPEVRVLGHPTCRLFPNRDGIDVDLKEVFSSAAASGTAMEINGAPDRRDLGEELIHLALEFGLEFCLGSDAHNDQNMEYMRYAVVEARRAGLPAHKIINTKSFEDLPGKKLSRIGGEK